jgi:hypothetical protein
MDVEIPSKDSKTGYLRGLLSHIHADESWILLYSILDAAIGGLEFGK